jgi:hypothetical protein
VVLRSFGDRVEVFAVSVSLSPSLGRIQPWPGVKPFTPLNFFQQVIPITKMYYREDRATLRRTNSVHIRRGCDYDYDS